MLAAACIFIGTYIVLAIGTLPGFRVDRTGAAIIGAGLMIAFNVLTLEDVDGFWCRPGYTPERQRVFESRGQRRPFTLRRINQLFSKRGTIPC